jgi:adiponectin receptor
LFENIAKIKNNLAEHVIIYKDKVVEESVNIFEHIENSTVIHYIEDLNSKLMAFSVKVIDLLDSKEMNWIDIYSKQEENGIKMRRWPLFVFLVSAVICLSSSAIFHWFSAHSKNYHSFLSRLDYAGISLLIAGSCYPPYFYFFYCEPCIIILF